MSVETTTAYRYVLMNNGAECHFCGLVTPLATTNLEPHDRDAPHPPALWTEKAAHDNAGVLGGYREATPEEMAAGKPVA